MYFLHVMCLVCLQISSTGWGKIKIKRVSSGLKKHSLAGMLQDRRPHLASPEGWLQVELGARYFCTQWAGLYLTVILGRAGD